MSWRIDLAPTESEERFRAARDDGQPRSYALHDYERIYAEPGLYEAVVQDRLRCRSPSVLSAVLATAIRTLDEGTASLRILEVGAGNGVAGAELRALGPRLLLGQDSIEIARDAAQRDRPGVYDAYLVSSSVDDPPVLAAVADHRLNCLVAVGASSPGHILSSDMGRLWRAFPEGSWFAATVLADEPDAPEHDIRSMLTAAGGHRAILHTERFVHRITMGGGPISYDAVLARK